MTIQEALAMESEIAYCLLNSGMKEAVYTVFDAMREQLVTGCNQWISVEERLPDEDCTVIAVVTGWNGRYVDVVVWDSVHSKFCRHVTHWMPLPEPPEGGAE